MNSIILALNVIASYGQIDDELIEEYLALFTTLFSGASLSLILTVSIIAGVLTLLISLALYLFTSYGLFQFAKKTGYGKCWLCWIPYARYWVVFNVTSKEFEPLVIKAQVSRKWAFIIFMIAKFGVNIITGIIGVLIGWIPYIGAAIVSIIRAVLSIAAIVAVVFFLYPALRDMFEMYLDKEQAKTFGIICIVCHFIAPVVVPIFWMFASQKAPREITVEVK